MPVIATPSHLHVRIYNDNTPLDSTLPIYRQTAPYDIFVSIALLDNGEARAEGMSGKGLTMKAFRELLDILRTHHVRKVTFRRRDQEVAIKLQRRKNKYIHCSN